jgi:hypothetical protein
MTKGGIEGGSSKGGQREGTIGGMGRKSHISIAQRKFRREIL